LGCSPLVPMFAGDRPVRSPTGSQSILVFGSGESAMSLLAAGFAELARPEFAWANCSGSTRGWERWIAELLEGHSTDRSDVEVSPREFRMFDAPAKWIERLVVPETIPADLRERLDDFARLPPLFQRLVSRFAPPEDRGSVVLTNADAFRSAVVDAALASARLHATLRREGVSLTVTFRGDPPSPVKEAFDQVLRVDSPRGAFWAEARVMSERGFDSTPLLLPQSLCDAWTILGLNPGLFPRRPLD
jgi:hypothetical protein